MLAVSKSLAGSIVPDIADKKDHCSKSQWEPGTSRNLH